VKSVHRWKALPEDSTDQPEIDLTTRRKALGWWSRQPLTRWQIFEVWIFVAILAAITGPEISWHFFEIVPAASIAFFLAGPVPVVYEGFAAISGGSSSFRG
jgi:hypothetical protein